MSGPFLLIAAFSGRAAGSAARRAGFMPLVADLFADADLCMAASGVQRVAGDIERGFEADALLTALGQLAGEAAVPPLGVAYGAGFEDRPELLARIAEHWPLLGNRPETVAAVKDPGRLASTCARLGIPHPDINEVEAPAGPGWLMKRRGGAGGSHVYENAAVTAGAAPDSCAKAPSPGHLRRPPSPARGEGALGGRGRTLSGGRVRGLSHRAPIGHSSSNVYWQRRVGGRPVSALFVRGGFDTQIIGFSEQWTAPSPGRPFRFGGAVCPTELPDGLADALSEAVCNVAAAFALRGLNSADFVIGTDGWWLLEINPRLGATLDIFDTPDGGLMKAHLAAMRGEPGAGIGQAASARAMQIVYAGSAVRVPAIAWPEWCADCPHPQEWIPAHAPLCTIVATASSPCEARRLCHERSQQIQKTMGVEECRTA